MEISTSGAERPKTDRPTIGVSTPLAWVRTKTLTEMVQGVLSLHVNSEHVCAHCSELAGEPVAYPCPTAIALLVPLDGA